MTAIKVMEWNATKLIILAETGQVGIIITPTGPKIKFLDGGLAVYRL